MVGTVSEMSTRVDYPDNDSGGIVEAVSRMSTEVD